MTITRDDDSPERQLAEATRGEVDREKVVAEPRRRRPWQRWIEAEYGLRDYWYPAAYSREVAEGQVLSRKLLGEDILLVRKNERVFAVADRCAHRGSRFSERPLVLSEDTITCWFHTWTFDLEDGSIRCILNDPNSVLSGKPGIKAYVVQEAVGMIWVFVGDGQPPPLEADLPPGMLDPNLTFHQPDSVVLNANWRLCVENGFDPGHHFIHNWSPFVIDSGFPMTFGYVSKRGEEHSMVDYFLDDPGPKGFTRCTKASELLFRATIPGKDGRPDTTYVAPGAMGRSDEELADEFLKMPPITVGIWMPVAVSIENFPGILSGFDFSVPIDDKTTRFFPMGAKRCKSEQEAADFAGDGGTREWKVPVVDNFLVDDNKARESMQEFYEKLDGWYRERLYRPDLEITMFRKFYSEHARALQPRPEWE